MLPEPISNMFCSRSTARARPMRLCKAGPRWLGKETCTTGISACGYISDNGTQAP